MEDLKKIYYEIIENIKKLEINKFDKTAFEIIDSLFDTLVGLLILAIISKRDYYYGYFLHNMKIEKKYDQEILAGIKMSSNPPIFVTNPLLLCKYKLNEILYIFCHEIEHIVLNHHIEASKINCNGDMEIHQLLNIACDASVNDRLILEFRANNLFKPIKGLVTSDTIKEMTGNNDVRPLENFVYYYNLIKDNKDYNDYEQSKSILNHLKEMSSSNVDNEITKEDENNSFNNTLVTVNDVKELQDHDFGINDVESSFIETNTRIFLESIYKSIQLINRGFFSSNLEESIRKLNEPAILPWQKLLKKYTGTIPFDKQKTRMRLNRRQPDRFDLRGTKSNHILNLVVAIDTSGSMTNKLFEYIFNEINKIIGKKIYKITIIECDSQINRVYKFNTNMEYKVKGRGGTAFTPVINYLNNDKSFRDALLIYFTDGDGEFEIPEPLIFKLLWVITGKNNKLSVNNPYGEISYLDVSYK